MGGHVVVPLVLIVAACGVCVWLVGTAELEEVLARWRAEREDRRAVDEWEAVKRELAATSPRVMRP